MNTNFSYDNKDYYSILEYLKSQASLFSNGEWTDFSDADIGTVLLKLMAMLSDTTNYQLEKSINELYLGSTIERSNAIALCKLIGYEPRHYMSAHVLLDLYNNSGASFSVPRFTVFTNRVGSAKYYTLKDFDISGQGGTVDAYEGDLITLTFQYSDIDENGRILLPDYNVGTNTLIVEQGGLEFTHVDNALFGESDACYSVHLNSDNILYIQFPPYWKNFITNSSFSVYYLISSGEDGRIGANILDTVMTIGDNTITVTNPASSIGGYNPESVEEIRISAPLYATTMDTLVTLEDVDGLAERQEGIADVVALDYNYPSTGLVQPDPNNYVKNDAYKVNVYVLPEDSNSIYTPGEETITHEDQVTLLENLQNKTLQLSFPDDLDTYMQYAGDEKMLEYRSADGILYYRMSIERVLSPDSCTVWWHDIVGGTSSMLFYKSGGTVIENVSEVSIPDIYGAVTYVDTDTVNLLSRFVRVVYTEEKREYTDVMKNLIAYINKRKLSSILFNYYDVRYIEPEIILNVYMDKNDLRYNTTAQSIKTFVANLYSRRSGSIGKSIYRSSLSASILEAFPYIKYVEIVNMSGEEDGKIPVGDFDFLYILESNVEVTMYNYVD